MNSFILGLLLSTFLTVLVPSPVSATISGTLTLNDDKLSARIISTPLDQVLEEFTRVSGVPIRWLNGKVSTVTVSVEFTHLPITVGLQQILAKQQFILFYSSDTPQARLTQIWITNKGDEQSLIASSRVKLTEPTSSVDKNNRKEDDSWTRMQPDQLTYIALQDNDPMLREKAVNYLEAYAHKDRRAFDALTRLAQQAPHAEVQELAAEALQQLE
jgi:hypothetical protein